MTGTTYALICAWIALWIARKVAEVMLWTKKKTSADCAAFQVQTRSRTRYAGHTSKHLARLTSTPSANAKSVQGLARCAKARRAVSF